MSKMKIYGLTLSYGPHPNGWVMPHPKRDDLPAYRVEKVVDSVDYHPGQILHENEVRTLCASRRWKVTIVPISGNK